MQNNTNRGMRLQFKSHELQKAFKVMLWSFGSAIVAFLGTWLAQADIPAEYLFLVPFANTILYALKEFFADNTIVLE